MDWSRFLTYLLVMAGVTYLIRMLPLAAIRGRVRSVFLQSFLYYVPYAVLGGHDVSGGVFRHGQLVFGPCGHAGGAWFWAGWKRDCSPWPPWPARWRLRRAFSRCERKKSVRVLHFSPKHGTIILAILGTQR